MPRELEHWRAKVEEAGLGFADDPITLALTLALPALFPVRDRRSAEALLSALPGFGAGLYDIGRTADLLTAPQGLGTAPHDPVHTADVPTPLVPADELVQEALAAYGEPDRGADVLADALRAVAAPDRPHAVAALCRLSGGTGVAAQAADLALSRALTDHPDDYAIALAQAVGLVADPNQILDLLHDRFPALSREVAVDAYLRLPRHDSRLGPPLAQIALEKANRAASGPAGARSAVLDLDLALMLSGSEQVEEAAELAHLAVENATTPDLRARALVVLARTTARLGHDWYAREKAEEAVALARPLGDDGLLFEALQTVVSRNIAVQNPRAVAASLETLELSRKFGPADQAVALSLACTAHTGARAAEFAAEAVDLLRDLADLDPVQYRKLYIAALDTHATALSDLGEDGFEVGQQALLLIQDLHRHDPATHGPQYAQVLLNFSNRLSQRGDHLNALEGYRIATKVFHDLVQESPRPYAARCATATWLMATCFARLDRWSEAETAIRGTLTLQRACVGESQPWVIPDLLDSLEFLKFCLSRAKKFAELPALEKEQQFLRHVHARFRTISGPGASERPR
ncbi:hypothetical protein ACFWN2_11040 [Lentzea sp. NPDC058436]|uniref:hypothetical protein n=1 Tax=Lentzea sp. NPDC058436 TaxID=3346499 RepID=UPI003659A43E